MLKLKVNILSSSLHLLQCEMPPLASPIVYNRGAERYITQHAKCHYSAYFLYNAFGFLGFLITFAIQTMKVQCQYTILLRSSHVPSCL